MQNRNVIRIFALIFAIVCVYQLSFTWIADSVEEDAIAYAANFNETEKESKEKFYLDSINSEDVYDILITSYTYAECKQREINLGLDLQGGSHILLDIDFDVVFAEQMDGIADGLRRVLREEKVKFSNISTDRNRVSITAADGESVRREARLLNPTSDVSSNGNVTVITLSDLQVRDITTNTINQTIEIVRRRVDETGIEIRRAHELLIFGLGLAEHEFSFRVLDVGPTDDVDSRVAEKVSAT